MIAKQKEELISSIKSELARYGFVEDSYGNFVNSDKSVRWKFKKNVLRRERSHRNADNKLVWTGVKTGYYSKLYFNESGRLVGFER